MVDLDEMCERKDIKNTVWLHQKQNLHYWYMHLLFHAHLLFNIING